MGSVSSFSQHSTDQNTAPKAVPSGNGQGQEQGQEKAKRPRKQPESNTVHWAGKNGTPLCRSTNLNPKFAATIDEVTCRNCRRNHEFPGERLDRRGKRKGEMVWIPAALIESFREWFEKQSH